MDDKYGIELEVLMGAFNKKINQIKNSFSEIKNQNINVSTNTAQINYLKSQIGDIENEIRRVNAGFVSGDILKLEVQLEKLTNQYNKLITKQNELKTSSTISTNNMSKGIDKIMSKIKRFGLSLLSIRSIWALVSRASSAYLSQDTELANKLQAAWIGLGAMLEPIISAIADVILKVVKYINIFIKALTGVDLLAKAVTKSLNNTTKSAKALQRALAGFDEINNLDTATNASGLDIGWINDLNNIDIDTKWADRIESFGTWIKKNKDTIIGVFTGITGAIIGIKLGLKGIEALGIFGFIYSCIKLITKLQEYLKKLDPILENNGTSFKEFGDIVKYIGLAIGSIGIIVASVATGIAGAIIFVVGIIIKYWNEIKSFLQGIVDWFTNLQENATNWFLDNLDSIGEHFGIVGQVIVGFVIEAFNWIVEIVKGVINIIINVFDGLSTGIKQIFDGILMIFKGDFKNGFINIGKGIVNAVIGILNGLISGINAIVYPIRLLITEIGKLFGNNWNVSNIKIPSIPYLDVGTNYVPEDQLAYIHKGEAVIPKKFNSQEYFGGSDDETKSLLQEIREAIKEIEINPYTTIKDVGKTAVNYINSKNRQLGGSVIN